MSSPPVFERWFLDEDRQGRLHGYLSYHAAAGLSLERRRLHRRFWTYDQILQTGRIDEGFQGIWSRPAGPVLLRDRPPDWLVEYYDWDWQRRNQFEIPGLGSRLAYFVRSLTVGDRTYVHGEGEDFRNIYVWTGLLEEALATEPDEAMEGAWVAGELVYGGWSGRLCWRQSAYELEAPIQAVQAYRDGSWVLVKSNRQTLIRLEDGLQRELEGASLAAFVDDGLAMIVDGCLVQQSLETGQTLDRRPLASPVFGLQWLPGRKQVALLHQDGLLRFYEPGTGLKIWELDCERALPLIPEENNLPFNFRGHAQFYPDGRLRFLASFCGLTQLHLSSDHGSGAFTSNSEELPEGWVKDPMRSVRVCGDHATEQRYYSNGTMEQFSAMDDNSEPHPVPFTTWVERCLYQIL